MSTESSPSRSSISHNLGRQLTFSCGLPVSLLTVNTPNNQGRHFVTCPRPMGYKCDCWFWVEPRVRRRGPQQGVEESILLSELKTAIEVMGSREVILLSTIEDMEKREMLLTTRNEALSRQAEGYWTVGKKNKRASATAIGVYNGICGTSFEPKFGVERVRKLHKCYKLFTSLIQRPWVTYDAATHSVSCLDTVWKVLYDLQMLVAPYINEGEHSYDSLKLLFNEVEDGDNGNDDIIQISSDTEALTGHDSSVVEIPNPYDSSLTSTHYSDGSSLNTDSIFFNELAWNYSDSETEASRQSICGSEGMSANSPAGADSRHRDKERCSSSGTEGGKGRSRPYV